MDIQNSNIETMVKILRILLIVTFVGLGLATLIIDICERESMSKIWWYSSLIMSSFYCLALKIYYSKGGRLETVFEEFLGENLLLGLFAMVVLCSAVWGISDGIMNVSFPYKGISLVCNSTIKAKSIIGGKGKNLLRYELGYNNIFSSIASHDDYQIGEKIYIKQPLLCNLEAKQYFFSRKDPEIFDFGFYDGNNLFTYHDYSLKNPDMVYYYVGFDVVYKAVLDSIGGLHFTDVDGNLCSIKYIPKNYTSVPDTFLVFRNINENIDDRFIVCAPEVNIPENWAKISDYGYIFHFDVYSKEEIESQCPQIRNYVEKYKERMKGK